MQNGCGRGDVKVSVPILIHNFINNGVNMNDQIKQVVPDLNFNNKSRLVMLTVGKFDQGFVVRNVLANKTIGLASMGDIYGMAAQLADELYTAIKNLLAENKAINIQVQVLDGQVGIIPLGFSQINDMSSLQKVFMSLNPLINRSGFKAINNNAGYKDLFSDAKPNDSELPLIFDPSSMFLDPGMLQSSQFGFGGANPFFIIPDNNDDHQVINSTKEQRNNGAKRYYSKEEKEAGIKVTEDGNKTRLEG